MSLFQFYSYIDGSLHVSGPQAHLQENSHSCSHNHWFSIRTVLVACSVCCGRSWWLLSDQDRPQHTEHATRTVRILNQWLWEQLCEFSWRWACGLETCRDPSIYEWNWNSDISWLFISYAEKMHGTKGLKSIIQVVFWLVNLYSLLVYIEHNGDESPKARGEFQNFKLYINVHFFLQMLPWSKPSTWGLRPISEVLYHPP